VGRLIQCKSRIACQITLARSLRCACTTTLLIAYQSDAGLCDRVNDKTCHARKITFARTTRTGAGTLWIACFASLVYVQYKARVARDVALCWSTGLTRAVAIRVAGFASKCGIECEPNFAKSVTFSRSLSVASTFGITVGITN
jgi:hypothetical protein